MIYEAPRSADFSRLPLLLNDLRNVYRIYTQYISRSSMCKTKQKASKTHKKGVCCVIHLQIPYSSSRYLFCPKRMCNNSSMAAEVSLPYCISFKKKMGRRTGALASIPTGDSVGLFAWIVPIQFFKTNKGFQYIIFNAYSRCTCLSYVPNSFRKNFLVTSARTYCMLYIVIHSLTTDVHL